MRSVKFLLVIAALATFARAQFLPEVVQSAVGTTTCVFNTNVTSGDVVVTAAEWTSSTNTPSVTDTRSTTYSQAIINTGNNVKGAIYVGSLGSGGADTITF